MHHYLYRVYCRTPPQWQHTKPAQLNGGTDTKMPASQTKGKCAGNTPNTLILANRTRSAILQIIPVISGCLAVSVDAPLITNIDYRSFNTTWFTIMLVEGAEDTCTGCNTESFQMTPIVTRICVTKNVRSHLRVWFREGTREAIAKPNAVATTIEEPVERDI